VNDGVDTVGDDTVRATLSLYRGNHHVTTLAPRIVAHPDRGIELAETSLRSTPLTDVQVVLRDADDDGRALLEVHVRPLVWFVWWGGLLLAASALWAAARAVRRGNLVGAGQQRLAVGAFDGATGRP
jgi:cytochrome c-type biogenesis protein CcmF